MKDQYRGIGIITPGNFYSLRIVGIHGDYEIVNQEEFMSKFFTVTQVDPFSMPNVNPKYNDIYSWLFRITKISKNKYRISTTDIKKAKQTLVSVNLDEEWIWYTYLI